MADPDRPSLPAGALILRSAGGNGAPARSLDVATPPFTAPAFGLARNVVEQAPSCRLRRHRSLPGPSHIPVSADSLRNQRPAPPSWPTCSAISSANPSFSTVFDGPAVNFVRWTIIFVHFCRLGRRHGRLDRPSLPPSHHFCPFLTVRRSILSVGPSFSTVFDGPAVNFVRQAIIICHFCWLDVHFCPLDHHFCPFLSAWLSSWPATTGHL